MKKEAQPVLLVLLLAGTLLRIAGAFHPLWLDEIWSCTIAAKLTSPFGVLTEPAALVDNNHPLNTFWLALIGNHQPYFVYHIPSVLAGIGTLFVIATAAGRRSRTAKFWAVALAAVSLPLIQFADEARGYALAAFFSVLMFNLVERFVLRPRATLALTFFACCVLGGLSHLLILHVYVGLAAMSVLAFWKNRNSAPPLRPFVMLHAGPLLFWLGYYALFVGRLKFGGGAPRWYLFQSVCDSLAGLIGYIGPASWLPALALAAALIALIIQLVRRNDPMWVFLAIGCFLSPIVLIVPQWMLSASPVPMASRYFLPLVPIVMVLFGDVIPRVRWMPAIASLILLINLINSVRAIAIGPSDADSLMEFVYWYGGPTDRVLADHPLRTKMVLDFYAKRLPPDHPVTIQNLVEHLDAEAAEAQWLVVHDRGPNAAQIIDIGSNRRFQRVRFYPAFGLSGYDFTLYERLPAVQSTAESPTQPAPP